MYNHISKLAQCTLFLQPNSSVTAESSAENVFGVMQSFLGASFPEGGRQTGKSSKKSNRMITGLGEWTYGKR